MLTRLDELKEPSEPSTEHWSEMTDQPAKPEELKELFGEGFSDEYQAEAQERWGETDAWKQSADRTNATPRRTGPR